MIIKNCVNHHQGSRINHPNCFPAIIIKMLIGIGELHRIIEDQLGQCKRNTMLGQIGLRLAIIPVPIYL